MQEDAGRLGIPFRKLGGLKIALLRFKIFKLVISKSFQLTLALTVLTKKIAEMK